MQTFLDHFAASLAGDAHAPLVLARAGWHGSRTPVVPLVVTLASLLPYAPKLNLPSGFGCSCASGEYSSGEGRLPARG